MAEEFVAPVVSVIVPVYNKRAVLRASLDSIVAASKQCQDVELIFLDHHSTDGSWDILREYADSAMVHRVEAATISAVRNAGARFARGRYLSFIDCDCVVPRDYFVSLPTVFEINDADAVGCECAIPPSAPWVERLWYELHVVRTDGPRHYLNAANFAVRRAVFEAIGGFDESLLVAEDTDICHRLIAAGRRIFESHALSVIHLDNPKTAPQFFRKQIWHGLAVLSGGRAMVRNKASVMLFVHVGAVLAALMVLTWPRSLALGARLAASMALLLVAPILTVVYRFLETGRTTAPAGAILLYALYYCARATALVSVLVGQSTRWRRRQS